MKCLKTTSNSTTIELAATRASIEPSAPAACQESHEDEHAEKNEAAKQARSVAAAHAAYNQPREKMPKDSDEMRLSSGAAGNSAHVAAVNAITEPPQPLQRQQEHEKVPKDRGDTRLSDSAARNSAHVAAVSASTETPQLLQQQQQRQQIRPEEPMPTGHDLFAHARERAQRDLRDLETRRTVPLSDNYDARSSRAVLDHGGVSHHEHPCGACRTQKISTTPESATAMTGATAAATAQPRQVKIAMLPAEESEMGHMGAHAAVRSSQRRYDERSQEMRARAQPIQRCRRVRGGPPVHDDLYEAAVEQAERDLLLLDMQVRRERPLRRPTDRELHQAMIAARRNLYSDEGGEVQIADGRYVSYASVNAEASRRVRPLLDNADESAGQRRMGTQLENMSKEDKRRQKKQDRALLKALNDDEKRRKQAEKQERKEAKRARKTGGNARNSRKETRRAEKQTRRAEKRARKEDRRALRDSRQARPGLFRKLFGRKQSSKTKVPVQSGTGPAMGTVQTTTTETANVPTNTATGAATGAGTGATLAAGTEAAAAGVATDHTVVEREEIEERTLDEPDQAEAPGRSMTADSLAEQDQVGEDETTAYDRFIGHDQGNARTTALEGLPAENRLGSVTSRTSFESIPDDQDQQVYRAWGQEEPLFGNEDMAGDQRVDVDEIYEIRWSVGNREDVVTSERRVYGRKGSARYDDYFTSKKEPVESLQ